MKWVRFAKDGRTRFGLVEGSQIVEVEGDPFSSFARTDRTHDFHSAQLEIPIEPRTFYCVGRNYVAHMNSAAAARGEAPKRPAKPDIGYRAISALNAHGKPVMIPSDATDQIHYEGELVAVIGKTGKHIPEDKALDYVFGYTIGNDVTERSWHRADRTMWRSKNTDTFKPMGPWIETDADLGAMETIIRLNGAEQIRFKTDNMIFNIPQYISAMSRYVTLFPGDVIWMGTDGQSPNLKSGDVVEVEITGVGVLRNEFLRGDA
jgi:2-keto-4-pentenoate hydratase/2-oxohepta-3-ene-1,7-dioic acid hydratase in catechol pathway